MAGNEIIALGILLMAGFVAGKGTSALRLPSVTGYILAGLLLGPSVLDFITPMIIERLEFINSLALSLIALSVGSKLSITDLKGEARHIISISLIQTVAVGGISFAALFIAGIHPVVAAILSATALATAPAAVMAVVEETRSSGPFTNSLLAVVAISNLIAVVAFGFTLAVAPIISGGTGFSMALAKTPLVSLSGSLLIGGVIGAALTRIAPMARSREELLIIILGTAFLTSELARVALEFSPILVNITIGFVLVNGCPVSDRLFAAIEDVDLPIYITFFSLQGAHLDITIIRQLGTVGILYILSRFLGKLAGSYFGALASGAPAAMRNYMGLSLFPQAGIAVGMVVAVRQEPALNEVASMITTVVLAAVLVNELIGPIAVKLSLNRAGENQLDKETRPGPPGGDQA